LNGVVTPFQGLGFSPYVGGGLGFASTHSTVNSLTDGTTTLTVDSSDSKTDFAADALAGFDVPVAQGFSLGARYQYLWINSGDTTTDSGVTEKDGNFSANVVTARATFKF
jgi:opacity protein-like surface antigen